MMLLGSRSQRGFGAAPSPPEQNTATPVTSPPPAAIAAGQEGSAGGKGTAWDVLPQHIPGVCEQPGEALAGWVGR